jgi:hypothetical protein
MYAHMLLATTKFMPPAYAWPDATPPTQIAVIVSHFGLLELSRHLILILPPLCLIHVKTLMQQECRNVI